jgi:RNA polymerase sigma-70 factor (family 1)
MKETADAELFELIKQSHYPAFNELHRRFWHPLYTIAYKKIGDQDEVNDLLQEMFIELWEKRETLNFTNAVTNWLRNRLWYKIAIYFRYKGFKQKHQESFMSFLKNEDGYALLTDSLELKEAETYYEEILNIINGCVDSMPERMREIFLLSKNENYSVKQIAEKLNISPKTVKTQLERAASKLKKAAQKQQQIAIEVLILLWLINY